eukprot:UN02584
MSKITLYYHPYSPPCRALRLLTRHFKVFDQIDWVFVDLTKGEHMKEDFLKKNPFHTVPTLEYKDANIVLFESPAIAHFLADFFKFEGDYGLPTDDKKWSVINTLHLHHNAIRAAGMKIFIHWMVTFFTGGATPFNKDGMIAGLAEAKKSWTNFDTMIAANGGFVAGDKPTIADVLAFCELFALTKDDGDHFTYSIYDFDEHPAIKNWLSVVKPIFFSKEDEDWKVTKTIVEMSKNMMPMALLEQGQ